MMRVICIILDAIGGLLFIGIAVLFFLLLGYVLFGDMILPNIWR